ncbi:type II secretion system protein [Candidatus Kaiserbacteria bacterium]|nr:type II secretion system protein [Candidatus Kaiserbacteria bacterium]USN92210.1 MAG: type II secretion system protein [Candidatus Nomurabacteria bacterium]
MKRKGDKQDGFTLIEILLYLSISVVMIALIGSIGVNVLLDVMGSRAKEELHYNVQFAGEKIRLLTSQAESVLEPIQASTSSVLVLKMEDPNNDPTVIDVIDGRIRVQEGMSEPEILSGENIFVSTVEFLNVSRGDEVGSLRLVLGMRVLNPGNRTELQSSTTLYTTMNLQYP